MSRRSRLPWLIIDGNILVVIPVAALFLYSPSLQPIEIPSRGIISSTDTIFDQSPGYGYTCIPEDVTELKVSVNGARKDFYSPILSDAWM